MAAYLVGVQSGISQETEKKWYKLTLLLQDSYGVWNTKFFFVQPKVFKAVEKYSLGIGSAVFPSLTVNGEKLALAGLAPDLDTPPVELVPNAAFEDDE